VEKQIKDVCLMSTTHDKMVQTRIRGQEMEKPKIVIDYNSGMAGVDISDAYLSQHKERLKKYYQKHFHHLIDICRLNSYLLYKKRVKHFQDGISNETYRKFNFKISYNRRETIRQTTRNCTTDKGEYCSLSLLHCFHSVKTKSMSALCYMLQKGSTLGNK
jgi:hypothetical protein